MDPGILGAIAGSTIGVLGGLAGTGCAIWRSESREERRFVVKATCAMWGFIALFLSGLLLIPYPYNHLLWLPYSFLLTHWIRRFNERQVELRNAVELGPAVDGEQ